MSCKNKLNSFLICWGLEVYLDRTQSDVTQLKNANPGNQRYQSPLALAILWFIEIFVNKSTNIAFCHIIKLIKIV